MMNIILLLSSAVVLISLTFLSKMSKKIRVPALLVFIFLGMVFGTEGIFKIDFTNFKLAKIICTVALIFIMFYGGFGMNWKMIKPVFTRAAVMASLGTVFTALVVGLFCHLVLKMEILEGFLLGAVISSTDAASVFSILKANKLSLKYNTDSLLEMESGANDPFSYLLTITLLSMIQGNSSFENVTLLLFKQLFLGMILGVVIAVLTVKIFKNFRFENEGMQSAFMIAIATEEVDMDFISTIIDPSSNWIGKKISDIGIPNDILITLIQRNGKDIIPNGETTIEVNDELVLMATTF